MIFDTHAHYDDDPSLGFSTMILWKQLNTQYIDSQHLCWLFSFFNT